MAWCLLSPNLRTISFHPLLAQLSDWAVGFGCADWSPAGGSLRVLGQIAAWAACSAAMLSQVLGPQLCLCCTGVLPGSFPNFFLLNQKTNEQKNTQNNTMVLNFFCSQSTRLYLYFIALSPMCRENGCLQVFGWRISAFLVFLHLFQEHRVPVLSKHSTTQQLLVLDKIFLLNPGVLLKFTEANEMIELKQKSSLNAMRDWKE